MILLDAIIISGGCLLFIGGVGFGYRLPHPLQLSPATPSQSTTEIECPKCGKTVSIWHTYGDGSIVCVGCGRWQA